MSGLAPQSSTYISAKKKGLNQTDIFELNSEITRSTDPEHRVHLYIVFYFYYASDSFYNSRQTVIGYSAHIKLQLSPSAQAMPLISTPLDGPIIIPHIHVNR